MTERSQLARASHAPAAPPAVRAPSVPASTRKSEPAAKHPARPAPARKSEQRVGGGPALAIIVTVLAAVNIAGWPYYSLPLAERVRSPLHEWLRPSGYVGQSAGILALLIFFFLWLYPFRKKYKWLAWTGTVAQWLDVHILVALALPLLLTIHAAWRFDGVIGLGFLSMMIVVASGVIGRYLYVRIPRSKTGVELTRDEVANRRRELVERISETLGLDVLTVEKTLAIPSPRPPRGTFQALGRLLTNDLTHWRTRRALRKRWKKFVHEGSFSFKVSRHKNRAEERKVLNEVVALASREMALAQQAHMLDATHNVFKWWHVAHRPFALTALLAVVIHVAVVVALGATWFR